jgi:hypothetical protein
MPRAYPQEFRDDVVRVAKQREEGVTTPRVRAAPSHTVRSAAYCPSTRECGVRASMTRISTPWAAGRGEPAPPRGSGSPNRAMNVLLLTSVDAPHIEEPGDVRPVVEGFEEEAADG